MPVFHGIGRMTYTVAPTQTTRPVGMAKKTKGLQPCGFCGRPFKGDKRKIYSTRACREGIIRSNPMTTKWQGFYTPANESPRLDVVHAVGEPNRGGGRAAAGGLYGRFVAGLTGDFEAWHSEVLATCWRCREAHIAWETPETGTAA